MPVSGLKPGEMIQILFFHIQIFSYCVHVFTTWVTSLFFRLVLPASRTFFGDVSLKFSNCFDLCFSCLWTTLPTRTWPGVQVEQHCCWLRCLINAHNTWPEPKKARMTTLPVPACFLSLKEKKMSFTTVSRIDIHDSNSSYFGNDGMNFLGHPFVGWSPVSRVCCYSIDMWLRGHLLEITWYWTDSETGWWKPGNSRTPTTTFFFSLKL